MQKRIPLTVLEVMLLNMEVNNGFIMNGITPTNISSSLNDPRSPEASATPDPLNHGPLSAACSDLWR